MNPELLQSAIGDLASHFQTFVHSSEQSAFSEYSSETSLIALITSSS